MKAIDDLIKMRDEEEIRWREKVRQYLKMDQESRQIDNIIMEKHLLDREKELKDIDVFYKRNITCPYCGHENKDSWEVDFGTMMEGEIEYECSACDCAFLVRRDVEVSYTSTKKTN